ncbi:MAG: SAM-dependent methyltransferase, partial [Sediminibacterium sp.]|nr:SAM-dependent methyltransferase [Sediminibacterium sp.]
GVADPGQILVAAAQDIGAKVNPLVGPNSILLALMASGLNGQQFRFHGYLPIDSFERKNKIKELEQESIQQTITQIFIETPYRNNQLLQDLVQQLSPNTRICVAVNLTHPTEEIILTKLAKDWKKEKADFHKKPAIFLIGVHLT